MAGNIHHFVSGYKEILMPGEGLTDGVLGNNFRLKSSVFGHKSKTIVQEEARCRDDKALPNQNMQIKFTLWPLISTRLRIFPEGLWEMVSVKATRARRLYLARLRASYSIRVSAKDHGIRVGRFSLLGWAIKFDWDQPFFCSPSFHSGKTIFSPIRILVTSLIPGLYFRTKSHNA